jgi:hypothetical protein
VGVPVCLCDFVRVLCSRQPALFVFHAAGVSLYRALVCGQLMAEMSTVQERIESLGCWNLGHTVEIAKKALRCGQAKLRDPCVRRVRPGGIQALCTHYDSLGVLLSLGSVFALLQGTTRLRQRHDLVWWRAAPCCPVPVRAVTCACPASASPLRLRAPPAHLLHHGPTTQSPEAPTSPPVRVCLVP